MGLTSAWTAHWRARPDATVLVDAADGVRLDGAAMLRETAAAAARLHAAGVRPGDRVLLSCSPGASTVLAYVAVLRLGAVVVPANTAYTRPELEHVVGDARPVLAVVDDPARVPLPPERVLTADRLAGVPDAGGTDAPGLDRAGDDALAMIGYTSGTTGRPKGAMLDHGNLRAGAEALVSAWGWTPSDRLVHALPMFHMHGLGAGVNGTLTAGASMVVLPRFEPAAVLDAVRDHAATMFFGVPTMYARLRDADTLPGLAGLRLLVSGSAPLDPVLFHDVARLAGQPPVERYGMTETVMLTSNPLYGERRAGWVGHPLPGVALRLDDDGAVLVRGPSVFRGYWERPEATAAAFTDDGWFRTGDVGELSDDGCLRLVGRASDLIITGGYNVYPREVEDAVREHPGVVDVAVVGVPDPTWGERVVAFVVLGDALADGMGADVARVLDEHAAGRLAAYKRPRAWTVVPDLPRNPMGKVVRSELRAAPG
ncbi:MAG: AMP-binding protein [Frankiales bacterium]|nr:AMP-binding protein [Frankiales bacterium]